MPVGPLFQATTRPETAESALQVELQQRCWRIGRPSRGCGCGALTAARREVEGVDKGVDATDGMLFRDSVVAPFWDQALCVAIRAVDKAHAGTKLQESQAGAHCRGQCYSLPKHSVFTQSGAWFGVAVMGVRSQGDRILNF